jgi:glycosyltransferase involved in cell wall biosynthesis
VEVYPECSGRTSVFHNLLNEERIVDMSRKGDGFTDGYDGFRILTVGRLVMQKGYDFAIQVMRLLKDAHVHARWYVLGEGPQRRQLEKQIEQYDLKEDFVLAGEKDNPYPYFAQADLYANMSLFEGKSIAIQEAQILGVPVIASDSSGNREQIIDRVDGILCGRDAETVRDEIIKLLNDKKLRETYAIEAIRRQENDHEQMAMLTEMLEYA